MERTAAVKVVMPTNAIGTAVTHTYFSFPLLMRKTVPSNHNAFGMTDLFGYQNLKMDRIHLDLAPAKRLSLLIEQGWLQVASVHDGVHGGAGSTMVKAPLGGFLSDDIGREFDASGQHVFLRNNLTLNFGIARFSPGALMQQNAHGADLTEGHFGLTYKFKVNRKDSVH